MPVKLANWARVVAIAFVSFVIVLLIGWLSSNPSPASQPIPGFSVSIEIHRGDKKILNQPTESNKLVGQNPPLLITILKSDNSFTVARIDPKTGVVTISPPVQPGDSVCINQPTGGWVATGDPELRESPRETPKDLQCTVPLSADRPRVSLVIEEH
ncbi:MAG: hypothetical protein JO100_18945 [Pseudonocardia sp.]|nr:hypothetical protein [Pseudonocardia sp.]